MGRFCFHRTVEDDHLGRIDTGGLQQAESFAVCFFLVETAITEHAQDAHAFDTVGQRTSEVSGHGRNQKTRGALFEHSTSHRRNRRRRATGARVVRDKPRSHASILDKYWSCFLLPSNPTRSDSTLAQTS